MEYDDNEALRREVQRLLQHHGQVGSFLDSSPRGAVDATIDQPAIERPGTEVGPYKLLDKIGEGGMGVVYMAEQKQPFKRRVALKIVKPGMDSRQVLARFEAEREALAMMDHPNIAKVLDAGTTDSGQPFFVMEMVKGISIRQYCDDNKLPTRQRVQLMIDVCHAIQHAHQKGIIHRDLKPSNILVALYDDRPVPKVIDFGVAKATHQKLTEKTLYTQLGQIVRRNSCCAHCPRQYQNISLFMTSSFGVSHITSMARMNSSKQTSLASIVSLKKRITGAQLTPFEPGSAVILP